MADSADGRQEEEAVPKTQTQALREEYAVVLLGEGGHLQTQRVDDGTDGDQVVDVPLVYQLADDGREQELEA